MACLLKTKKADEVAAMLKDIYKMGSLSYPQIFQCDNGSEFKGAACKFLDEHGVVVKRYTTKYDHMKTLFAELLNKRLGSKLFAIQDVKELKNSKTTNTEWVKYLYRVVNKMKTLRPR